MSAWPRTIVAAPSPSAVEPVAQAETGAQFGPVSPSWIAIWPLAVSTRADGMKNGETRSAPRSRNTRCCSAIVAIPPIAEPTRIPTRAGSKLLDARFVPSLLRGGHGQENVPVHPPCLFRRDQRGRIEPVDLAGDRDGELARVERLDEADPAAAREGSLPGGLGIEADRRDGSEAGDDDATHDARDYICPPSRGRRVASTGWRARERRGAASRSKRPAELDPLIPFPPMEAELVRDLPLGDGWAYEPKWDGFRGVLENVGGELAPLVAEREAAAALLPRAAAAR